jgi:predicted glycosyltransferase
MFFNPLLPFPFLPRIIQKLSDTLCLPNIVNLNARRKSGFDENDAIDWNEKNASSVLQVSAFESDDVFLKGFPHSCGLTIFSAFCFPHRDLSCPRATCI